MSRTTRAGSALLAAALFGAAPAMAQIPGMPLFTNPRLATGFRIHADLGQDLKSDPNGTNRLVQGGVGFVLGPVGIDANLGTTLASAKSTNGCATTPTMACLKNHYTLSALAQLKLAGGGMQNLSLSAFAGASTDIDSAQFTSTTGGVPKLFTIPVGAAVGLRVPLGMASLNLWGAPRYVFSQWRGCTGCTNPKSYFGWAVGADLPIFRILSVRAAFDSHKNPYTDSTETSAAIGLSIGLGGMR